MSDGVKFGYLWLYGLQFTNLSAHADEASTLKVRGLFYGIGHQPNSHLFAEDVEVDEAGYVKVSPLFFVQ